MVKIRLALMPRGGRSALTGLGALKRKRGWPSGLRRQPRMRRMSRSQPRHRELVAEREGREQPRRHRANGHRAGMQRAIWAVLKQGTAARHRRRVASAAAGLNPLRARRRTDLHPGRRGAGAEGVRDCGCQRRDQHGGDSQPQAQGTGGAAKLHANDSTGDASDRGAVQSSPACD